MKTIEELRKDVEIAWEAWQNCTLEESEDMFELAEKADAELLIAINRERYSDRSKGFQRL